MPPPAPKVLLAVLALALFAQGVRGQSTSAPPAGCPPLEVSCPDVVRAGDPVTFSLTHAPSAGAAYTWAVSAGTITSGQGTHTIVVDTAGLGSGYVKATVEAKGLPASCPNSGSCTGMVAGIIHHDKIDEYGNIRFNDEKARLDNLAIELQNDPTAKGYLIGYAGRRARVGEARRRIERAKRYLTNSLKIAPERVATIDGGHRENLTVELWVFPADAQPPYVSPTVDPSEVTIIKTKPKRRSRPR